MTAVTTQIPIGLIATQVAIDTLDTTPIQILGNPMPVGRHMIAFFDASNSLYVGAIDLMVTNLSTQTLSESDNCYSTTSPPSDWNFGYADVVITLQWDSVNNNMSVSSSSSFSNLVIREFVIPVFEDIQNIYAADRIQANLSAENSPVTFASPIVQSATGANAVNLGQATVTQATSISTAVTANGSSGVITTVSATTSSGTTDSFVVNNSTCTATSSVIATLCGYTGTGIPPMVTVSSISSGNFTVNITNINPSASLNGVLTISFLCC
jgi:hypothetical protein